MFQGTRIKQRKDLKRQRDHQNDQINSVDEHGVSRNTETSDNEDVSNEDKETKRHRPFHGKPVFSSLFTKNPEIPNIER